MKAVPKDEPDWYIPYHFDFGMYVRNLLREGDFNAPLLQDSWFLDENWDMFLLKAIEYSD